MSAVSASTPQGAIISKKRPMFKLHQCAGLPLTCIASHLAQEYQPHQKSQSSPLAATLATSSSVPSCPPQNQALQPPQARPPHLAMAMASTCLSSSRSSISPVHSGMMRQAQAFRTKARVHPRSSMHSTGRRGSTRMKCRKRRMRMSSSVSVTVRYVSIARVHVVGSAELVKTVVDVFSDV